MRIGRGFSTKASRFAFSTGGLPPKTLPHALMRGGELERDGRRKQVDPGEGISGMINKIFSAIASGSRNLFRNWRVLIILLVLYLAMLGAVYWFIATREATLAQLLLSLLLAVAAPVLFLVIQTIAARHRDSDSRA